MRAGHCRLDNSIVPCQGTGVELTGMKEKNIVRNYYNINCHTINKSKVRRLTTFIQTSRPLPEVISRSEIKRK